MIYTSLIQSKLMYGLLLWGKQVDDVIKIHKRAIRAITSSNYIAHTEPLLKRLGILNMTDLYKLRVLKFYFKLRHSDLPCYFIKYLEILNDTCYNYNLRNNTIRTPLHHHSFATHNLLFECRRIIQLFPNIVINKIDTHSLNGFSIYAKKWLLDKYVVECNVVNCFTCLKK